jgi:hypothetical protein
VDVVPCGRPERRGTDDRNHAMSSCAAAGSLVGGCLGGGPRPKGVQVRRQGHGVAVRWSAAFEALAAPLRDCAPALPRRHAGGEEDEDECREAINDDSMSDPSRSRRAGRALRRSRAGRRRFEGTRPQGRPRRGSVPPSRCSRHAARARCGEPGRLGPRRLPEPAARPRSTRGGVGRWRRFPLAALARRFVEQA